jgi:ribonuclease BN (tRNA processing enzyme)
VGIVGSGVLLPDDRRRSSGHWISAEAGPFGEMPFRVLLDCGSGTLHGMDRDGLPWREVSHLVISHFHADHIGDVAPLVWALKWGHAAGRERPLRIVGPVGLHGRMKGLATAFGDWVLSPGFPVEIHEVAAGERWADDAAGLSLVTHAARHSPEALAWRVEAREGRVGYTGDTGPIPGLGTFFRGVNLLIAECAVSDPNDLEIHLSPAGLAPMAEEAAADLLVTVHHYPELDLARLPDLLRAAGYTGNLRVGEDGLGLVVGPSGVRLITDSTHENEPGRRETSAPLRVHRE